MQFGPEWVIICPSWATKLTVGLCFGLLILGAIVTISRRSQPSSDTTLAFVALPILLGAGNGWLGMRDLARGIELSGYTQGDLVAFALAAVYDSVLLPLAAAAAIAAIGAALPTRPPSTSVSAKTILLLACTALAMTAVFATPLLLRNTEASSIARNTHLFTGAALVTLLLTPASFLSLAVFRPTSGRSRGLEVCALVICLVLLALAHHLRSTLVAEAL